MMRWHFLSLSMSIASFLLPLLDFLQSKTDQE
jgi:hypothetical protein